MLVDAETTMSSRKMGAAFGSDFSPGAAPQALPRIAHRRGMRAAQGFIMKSKSLEIGLLICTLLALMMGGCDRRVDAAAEAPPPANVVPDVDLNLFAVDHPEQFPLVEAIAHPTTSELVVTGTVVPDVARNVPVVSLASGRVVAIHARLGDTVQKGQLLLTIRSDDVAGGFDAYRKAVADELLAQSN